MAFDHKNFATHGLFPGLVTTRSIANLGHFKIEITIEKIPGRGGATTTSIKNRKDKYKVYIKVSYKQRWWEYEQEVTKGMAQVIAKMTGQQLMDTPDPEIEITSVKEVKPEQTIVKVDKR